MKSKKLIVAFVALLALSVSARESDGLYFDLKCLGDANDNGRLDLNEAVNAMAVGVAGGGASIYGNPANNPVDDDQFLLRPNAEWFYGLCRIGN